MGQRVSLALLVGFFFLAGLNHFLRPALYLPMIPPALPWPLGLIFLSGAAEMAGALGAAWPGTRRLAGWGLIALLAAVFPANLHAAFHGFRMGGVEVAPWLLWARLPFQFVLIGWVWWSTQAPRKR